MPFMHCAIPRNQVVQETIANNTCLHDMHNVQTFDFCSCTHYNIYASTDLDGMSMLIGMSILGVFVLVSNLIILATFAMVLWVIRYSAAGEITNVSSLRVA